MAEFKLGRIKFVYQGAWASSTTYVVDDVVTVGGKSYICVRTNTSSATFATDLNANPTNWNLVADGTRWLGNWSASTYYVLGDQVQYGGTVYQCNTAHTSGTYTSPTFLGLEADQSKWTAFATSLNWSNGWSTSTRYKVRDLVTYGGYTYLCNTAHISASTTASGLENDIAKWDVFNAGIIYRNAWSGSSVKYRLNDVVTYGADLFICTTAHVSTGSTLDATKFALFVSGFQFENSWSISTLYQLGDMVTYGGNSYTAIQNNSGQNPSTATAYWQPYTTGFSFQGDWNSSNTYLIGSVVRVNGYTYLATADSTNQTPPNASYWTLLNSGMKWNPIQGTYSAVASGTNVVGTGTGAKFDVVRINTKYTVTVTSGFAGTGYAQNDTIKILGTALGGLSPSNDLLITVATVSGGAIATITVSGISVTWTTGTTYVAGDVTFWNVSSYICVSAHVAGSPNRPDSDLTGTYWNLLASGTEQAVLTTQGDMFYYGSTGPTRLPIGKDGQILRVSGTVPAWSYYGQINNIVYVASTGTDTLADGQGTTIDKPWATIRYACKQVEDGYLNTNATALIAKNKQFMMKEVSAFVVYAYTFNVTATASSNNRITVGAGVGYQATTTNMTAGMPIKFNVTAGGITAGQTYYVLAVVNSTQFTITTTFGGINAVVLSDSATANIASLVYDATKCERDAGYLAEALVFDLGHGGNSKHFAAAQSYFNSAGGFITTSFGYQATQSLASYNYLKNYILPAVLGNTAPATNYQSLISASPTATQIIDSSLTAETGVLASGQTLLTIVTNAIQLATNANIPALINPQSTISVKTGTYNEILPIVLPAFTAIVGDELRSTVIQPAAAIGNLVNDKPKSIAAMKRIQSVVANLISNATVTPTSGNTQTQVTTLPAGDVGSTTATASVKTNAELMYDIVANGISNVPNFVLPTVTGYNTSFLSGYGDGKAQVVQNYQFIKDEISAYLNVNYNSVWTVLGAGGQANCTRDVGYILDAIQYDMTYGGNTQSLLVGNSYYSNYILTIASSEKTATLAAYARLKTIIGQIATKTNVTPTAGNSTSQVTTGTAGSAGSSTFAQARIQDTIDWITNGTAPTASYPTAAIALTSSALQASYNALQAARTAIQNDTVAWVKKFFQNMNFNSTTCSRDAGLIVDALSYDLVFGSNFASITVGRSYNRNIASVNVVRTSQLAAELGAINFIKYKAKHIAAAGSVAQITNLIDDITGYITNGSTPRYIWPDPSNIVAGDAAAAKLIWQNKAFIQAEVASYLGTNYSSVWNAIVQATCQRDVGYIIDALRYDITYGGNWASLKAGKAYYSYVDGSLLIAASEKTATLAAMTLVSSIAQAIAQGGAYTALQGTVARVTGTNGTSTQATTVSNLMTIISNVITSGNTTGVPTITITTVAGTTTFTSGTHGLSVNDLVIPQSTANGLVAGTIYYVASTPLTTTFTLSASFGGAAITTFTNGTGLSIVAEINKLPSTSTASTTTIAGATTLSSNRATLQTAVTTFIATTYPNLVYNTGLCARDVGYIIDAISYDMMLGTNFQTIKSGMSYFEAQASKVVLSQRSQTIASYNYLASQIATTIASNSTAAGLANTSMTLLINILTNGIGETPEVHGTITYNNTLSTIKGVEILRANKTFLAYEASAYIGASYGGTVTTTTTSTNVYTTSAAHNFTVGDPVVFSGTAISNSGITVGTQYYVLTAPSATTFTLTATQFSTTPVAISSNGSGSMTVKYSYSLARCLRDTNNFIDAIVYDLQYPGNYKSLRGARLYNNAVAGSITENMFLVRNGTGIRNTTMNGLTGYLSNANSYGTKRPTGGAYASLDPGFGPNDSNVWIYSRSCYVQNNTMFGYAAVGAKVDGALHNGGYRSMVANDYTTILGDGIGFWVTGSNSLAELVSVFNYYGYAGYVAELGARIRATNGNSSYGTYGVIAEGVDTYEVPVYGNVNNRYFQAVVGNTITDGTNNVLRLEYTNAGANYTNTVTTISGSGYNAAVVADEFRDAAVMETRIIDVGSTSNPSVGGTQYVTQSNVSQGGAVGYIVLAATDTALTGAYNNMRVHLNAGTAVGQYANILTYANGTKQANIVKDSFQPLIVTATQSSNNLLTVASTASLYVGMPIYFNTSIDNLGGAYKLGVTDVPTLYYVIASNFSSTQFAVSTLAGGSAVSLAGGTAATVTVTATAITNNLITATNTLVAGQAITFSAAFNGIDTGTIYYVLGNNLSSSAFAVSTYPFGPSVTITATGSATSTGTVGTALFAAGWDHVIPGNAVLNVPDLTSAYIVEPRIAYSAPGFSSTARTMSAGTAWSKVAYGAGYYVAVSTTDNKTSYSTDGKTWTAGATLPQTANWSGIQYGGGEGAQAAVLLGGFGGSNAVLTAVLGTGSLATQVVSITIVSGGFNYTTPPTIIFSGGGGTGATATCTVLNGAIATVTVSINGSGYTSVPTVLAHTGSVASVSMSSWGKNFYSTPTATVDQPQGLSPTVFPLSASATNGTYYQVNASKKIYLCTQSGTTSSSVPTFDITSANYTNIANGTATFTYVATQATVTPTLTNYGVSALVVGIAGYGYTSVPAVTILDTSAKFVVVSSSTTDVAYATVANIGTTWSSSVSDASTIRNFGSIAYGGGFYVTVGGASGTGAIASSSDGTTWIARTGSTLSAGYYSAVAYGAGRFVAINNGGRVSTVSTNSGATWTAGGLLPNATTAWTGLAYGNGRFVAISSDGINTAYSTDGAVTWYLSSAGMPVNQQWGAIGYGGGQFVAVPNMPTPTITATASTSNLITLSSTSGLNVGNTIIPSVVTQTTTSSLTTTTTATSYNNAKIAGTVATIPTLSGTFANGMVLTGGSITANTYITATNTFTATGSSIAGTTLTIGTVTSGSVAIGQAITGSSFSNTSAMILPYNGNLVLSGTTTGTVSAGQILSGTGVTANTVYVTSPQASSATGAIATGTVATIAGTISGTTLTVTANSGTIQPGMVLAGGSVTAGTFIVTNLTGTPTGASSTWTVSVSQTATGITSATPVILTLSGTFVSFFAPGTVISGGTTTAGSFITAQATATAAAVGTQNFASGGAPGATTVTLAAGTNFATGQLFTGTGVFANTYVTNVAGAVITISQPFHTQASGSYNGYAAGIGGTYYVTPSQAVTSTTMTGVTNTTNSTTFVPLTSTITGTLNCYISANLAGTANGSTWTITNATASTTVASTTLTGTSFTVNNSQTQTATTITGTNNLVTLGSTSGMTVGEPIVFTAVTQNTTASAVATSGNLITVGTTAGMLVGEPITFGSVTQNGTLSASTVSGNLFTVSSTTGLVVGERIVFTNVTQTPTLTATTTGSSSLTGYIAGTTLTVMFTPSATITAGMLITGTVTTGTYITTQLTATNTAAATTTSSTGSGVSVVILTSATGVAANQLVTGTGIPNGTFVRSDYVSGTTINLVDVNNAAVLTTQALGSVSFYTAGQQGTYTVTPTQTSGSSGSPLSLTATENSITLSSNTGIVLGSSFQVASNVGGLLSASVYYVTEIIGSTKIAVGATSGATTNTTVTTTSSQSIATTVGAVLGGITSGTTYYVASIPTPGVSGTITLNSAYGSGAVTVTVAAKGAWTWVAGAVFGNLSTSTTYYIASIPTPGAGGTITIATTYGGNSIDPGNGNGAWTVQAGATFGGITSAQSYFISEVVSGTQVAITGTFVGVLGNNVSLTNSAGAWTVVSGAVLGNLSSGGTYYIKSISGNQITVSAISPTGTTFALIDDTGSWTSKTGTTSCATSWDGFNWYPQTLAASSSWGSVAFGNPATATLGAQPLFVTISKLTGTVAASVRTGARPLGRTKAASGTVSEIRMIEPGSGFGKGNVTATTVTTNVITVDDITFLSTSLANNQPIEFNASYGNLTTNTTYFVIGSSVTVTSGVAGTFQVTATAGSTTAVTLTTTAPSGMTYNVGPIVTIMDPNHVTNVGTRVRMSNGALGNPSFTNRGTNNATATASTLGDGYSDLYQNTAYINLNNLYQIPSAGCNVQFASITGDAQWYKLVTVTNVLGVAGNYTAQFTINPALTTLLAPPQGTLVTTRLKYSQVRLTGHDFLYIGTGNQAQTNYPYVDASKASQAAQQKQTGGGRCFFTSTDQDGNFNVGNLFGVQQSTGTATLNASAFNLAGLQSLTLGAVSLGVGSATITQFSTDPYFTANSDNILPTQKAIKSFITAQIGGGQSTLNVNTITAGQIYIANNSISNTTGNQIYVSSKMLFTGGIDGSPVALVFFGQK